MDSKYRSARELEVVGAIGEQFRRLDEEASRPIVRRPFVRPLALALVGTLLVATAAGAATGD